MATTTPQTAAQQLLQELSSRWPRPTNAQALAALRAFGHATATDEAAAHAGFPPMVARAFCLPLGVLPRMRLRAAGWRKPGDAIRNATSEQWAAAYDGPLWEVLGTFVDLAAKHNIEQGARLDEDIATGDSATLAQAADDLAAELAIIQAALADHCEPYLVPRRRGAVPEPNAPCMASIAVRRRSGDVPVPRRPEVPWWVWAFAFVALASATR
jgi:hypothetical protein